jgi:hypothetical protein
MIINDKIEEKTQSNIIRMIMYNNKEGNLVTGNFLIVDVHKAII